MDAVIRVAGNNLRFEKRVSLDALPDVGDAVRVRPVGDWLALFGDEPVNAYVTGRSFVQDECDDPDCGAMSVVIDAQKG